MRINPGVIKRSVILLVAWAIVGVLKAQTPTGSSAPAAEAWREAPPVSTGIEVGEKIPTFSVKDQSGKLRDFKSIAGPSGAMIVFQRSVDW